jgi:hypothetical protein
LLFILGFEHFFPIMLNKILLADLADWILLKLLDFLKVFSVANGAVLDPHEVKLVYKVLEAIWRDFYVLILAHTLIFKLLFSVLFSNFLS